MKFGPKGTKGCKRGGNRDYFHPILYKSSIKCSNPKLTTNPSSNHYSSLLILNRQWMNPNASSTSKWKVHGLMSLIDIVRTQKYALPFITITETCLKSYIADAQLQIPGYTLSRCELGTNMWEEVFSSIDIRTCPLSPAKHTTMELVKRYSSHFKPQSWQYWLSTDILMQPKLISQEFSIS